MNHAPTLYVVEDDAAIREAIGLFMTLQQIPVRCFASAEELLSAQQSDWVGCFLIDLRLPGMSGLMLIEKLRHREIQLPTILMTGHEDLVTIKAELEQAGIRTLEKPFSTQQLIAIVTDCFHKTTDAI